MGRERKYTAGNLITRHTLGGPTSPNELLMFIFIYTYIQSVNVFVVVNRKVKFIVTVDAVVVVLLLYYY